MTQEDQTNLPVLIVDPDAETRDSLGKLLRAEGYTVTETESGAEALAYMRSGVRPALVLLSSTLPDVDGIEACRQLRALPDQQDLSVLMLMNAEDDPTIAAAFEAGAMDYLLKPVRPVLLLHRTRHLLRRRETRERMRMSEARYRVISSMISDYAYGYIVNEDGSLTKNWSTKAFHDITGYSRDEIMSRGYEMMIHPDDMPIAQARYEKLLKGESDISEFRILTKNGDVRWLLDHGYPVFNPAQGRVVEIFGAAQDITHRKAYEEALRQQAEELRRRNEELDAFAYTVAHDLKNPIASMMGFASLIQNYFDRMPAETVKEYLNLIMEGGYKLKEIINALLLLAGVNKMESAEMSELDMQAIIDGAKKRLASMITESSAVITVPVEWPRAAGYAPWVEEIWANYISNALKYGGKPPRIDLGADELPDGTVRFWVRDNGRGLTVDEQQRVFTPFTRLNQVKVEGHGLGLSVVQRIVDKLGGKVGVESTVGKGSIFSFTLPPL
ncbi:MAG: ATP-binding protein [bacterium]|nr:ATP-binding protein [bacterium]